MKFHRRNASHAISECGRYVIARYGLAGSGAYQATRLIDRTSLRVERFKLGNEEARAEAYRSCVHACEQDESRSAGNE